MDELKHIYTIDFTDVKQYLQMHQVIQVALDFPKYYGCNWDAFWDCLTDMVGRPIHIQIMGLGVIEQKFGSAAEKMISILKEFKHYSENYCNEPVLIEIVLGESQVKIE